MNQDDIHALAERWEQLFPPCTKADAIREAKLALADAHGWIDDATKALDSGEMPQAFYATRTAIEHANRAEHELVELLVWNLEWDT
jgi:hypothetical protein